MNTTGALALLEQGIGSHALQHNGLASHAQEWQRELDRAQARAWFHPTATARSEAADGPVREGPGTALQGVAAPPQAQGALAIVQPTQAPWRAGPAGGQACFVPSHVPLSSAGEVCAMTMEASAERPWTGGSGMPGRSAAANASREASGATSRRLPDAPHASAPSETHLHVEADGEGVRVWIGLGGGDLAASTHAAALLPQLRRALEAEGHRLLALTCNGRLVDEAASPSPSPLTEQSTWRSER